MKSARLLLGEPSSLRRWLMWSRLRHDRLVSITDPRVADRAEAGGNSGYEPRSFPVCSTRFCPFQAASSLPQFRRSLVWPQQRHFPGTELAPEVTSVEFTARRASPKSSRWRQPVRIFLLLPPSIPRLPKPLGNRSWARHDQCMGSTRIGKGFGHLHRLLRVLVRRCTRRSLQYAQRARAHAGSRVLDRRTQSLAALVVIRSITL